MFTGYLHIWFVILTCGLGRKMHVIYSFIATWAAFLACSQVHRSFRGQPVASPLMWIVCILPVALIAGCGSGERTYRLHGQVTYQGRPVPQGYIVFEPDSARGNSGAAARSKIEDGRYDTRGAQGRGAIGGPHIIRIVGLDGKIAQATSMEEESLPRPLFPPYTFSQELPTKDSVLNFDVPST